MGNILEIYVNQITLETVPYSELVKTLFPVESKNSVKIKITHHSVMGDGCIWEGMPFMNAY